MKKRVLAILLCLTTVAMTAGCGVPTELAEAAKEGIDKVTDKSEDAEDEAEEEEAETDEAGVEETAVTESTEETPAVQETEAPKTKEKPTLNVGETWTVDGQWTVTVTGVTESEYRNEYSDKNPAAVYVIDYVFTNEGYEDSIMDGLYIGLDSQTVVDAGGVLGYSYPGEYSFYPQETPIGAVCKAQACVGVDTPGAFTIQASQYDNEYNKYEAIFNCDPAAEAVDYDPTPGVSVTTEGLNIGETWTVDGQWEITVTGVTATDDRNEFSDYAPEAVYFVDYTYTNIGYEDDIMDGLYISLDDGIVDAAAHMGYGYPGSVSAYPQATPVGATCNAQVCIGVDHAGPFKLFFSQYDGNEEKQSQIFNIAV